MVPETEMLFIQNIIQTEQTFKTHMKPLIYKLKHTTTTWKVRITESA